MKDNRTLEERIKHEAAFDAYAAENPDHTCHIIGCDSMWNPSTGTLIVVGGGRRNECARLQVYFICDQHDDEAIVTVNRDGSTVILNT